MKKKLLAILLMLVLCAGMMITASAATITAVKPATGDGTANNPYLISTAAELYWFANTVNQGDYDACAKLTADITVNERTHDDGGAVLDNLITWMPIGSGENPYTGTFDGNNHTVSGLYFERAVMYMGFFGSVDRGSVLNLTVANSCFLGRNSYVGIICGQNLEGTITNCHARDCILVGMNCSGGIAGSNEWDGTISRCSSNTTITCDGDRAGGIVGFNDGTISNCYNTGNVVGDDEIGGIAGYQETTGTISCCYNTGSVIGTNTSKNLGGIVGNAMNVTSCYYLDSSGISFTNQKGKALTAAQMTDDNTWRANYTGFSTNIWSKSANEGNKAYLPKLNSYSPYLPGFSITISNDGNGTASASPKAGATNTPITLTATPAEGYAFKEWQVVKGGVTITDNKFTMGSTDVEIKAIFEAIHTCGNGTVVDGQSASCTTDGWADYYRCSCGKLYEEADCITEITDLAAWKTDDGKIPAAHQYGELIEAQEKVHTQTELKPSVAAHYYCDACGNYFTAEKAATTLEALTGPTPEHDTNGNWVNTDPEQHWKKCSVCELEDSAKAGHVFDNDQDTICNDCGYVRTVAPKTYTVTVTGGSGSGEYKADATVTITADAPAEGKQFSGWTTSDDVSFTDANAATTTFVMPAKAVTVTANYEDIPPVTYTVTVTGGSGSGEYEADATVTITADKPAEGKQFSGWTSDDVSFTDANAATTTFVMPAKAVTVTANYEELPPVTYSVTVTTDGNGTASASPVNGVTGTEVTLTATPAEGYTFNKWQVDSGNVTITDNKFQIGVENVAIKAIFEAIPVQPDPEPATYSVTFDPNGGMGSMQPQTFTEGVAQPLTKNAFTREGYTFTGWNMAANGTGMGIADGASTMVTGDVTLYAQWKANETPKPNPNPDPKPEVNPLLIIQHPVDQVVEPGETADFTVVATGDGLSYQWYINRNDGRGWVRLQGANSPAYTTSAADKAFDGFQYACEVRDMHGNTARSDIAVLYIAAQPDVPPTGDSTNISLLCAMLFISCAGWRLIAAQRKRAMR